MTMDGKVMDDIQWNYQNQIDMTGYSSGTYMIGLHSGSSVKTERVVIL
jgi:hypothetical protein